MFLSRVQPLLRLCVVVAVALSTGLLSADVRVRGHYRNGKWVAPHYRSNPDGNFGNNWSTAGNVNPYTGERGTKRHPSAGLGETRSRGNYSASASASRSGDVSVRGHYRDGKWVAPHRRSRPDSDFSNNWSTAGNVNPYTGEPGTLRNPPNDAGFASPSSASRNRDTGEVVAADRTDLSVGIDLGADVAADSSAPAESPAEPVNRLQPPPPFDGRFTVLSPSRSAPQPVSDPAGDAMRMRMAGELRDLGHPVMWQEHTYAQMSDMADRIRKARELERAGMSVDWQKYSWHQLCDMLARRRAG